MLLEVLPYELTVCKVAGTSDIDLDGGFYFVGRTPDEISLVCPTKDAPAQTAEREDGWRGFRIAGKLDFSLIGILARVSAVLAEAQVGIFAVSTFDTDYILVKGDALDRALDALVRAGYEVTGA